MENREPDVTDKMNTDIAFGFCLILSNDISLETSFQDVSNDMSLDRIRQEWNEIFQTVEFTSTGKPFKGDMELKLYVWLVVLSSFFGVSMCQTSTDAINLSTALFTTNSYNYRIRPILDQTDYISIYAEFNLMAINSVDEVTETMKTTGYLAMYWLDEFLTWTPSDYGGMTRFFWPQNEVWKPDVALKNSFKDYKQLGDPSLNVIVYNNGEVRWAPFQVFESTCAIDITYFPYDVQTCSLTFVAWSYTKDEIYMEGGAGGVILTQFEENSAWKITNTSWYEQVDAEEASITFVIEMQRKPLYNILTLVFPVIMLAILDLLVFVLPCESGEKAGYAVTVFLAFAVFLTIMEASFPQNSETIAIFAIYVVIETVQSTLITFIALLMVRVSSFGEETPIPKWLIGLARFSKCKPIRERLRKNKVRDTTSVTEVNLQDLESISQKKKDFMKDEQEEQMPEKLYTWKYIVNALDVFCFVFFLVAFLVATLVCLLTAKFN